MDKQLALFSGKWVIADKFIKKRNRAILSKRENREKNYRISHHINAYKVKKGCQICAYNSHACALTFDHIDPLSKQIDISREIDYCKSLSKPKLRRIKIKRIFQEIRKCQILCANCHAVKSKRESQIKSAPKQLLFSMKDCYERQLKD